MRRVFGVSFGDNLRQTKPLDPTEAREFFGSVDFLNGRCTVIRASRINSRVLNHIFYDILSRNHNSVLLMAYALSLANTNALSSRRRLLNFVVSRYVDILIAIFGYISDKYKPKSHSHAISTRNPKPCEFL